MIQIFLGIGSRVNHPEYDHGVITNINQTTYEVTFIKHGQIEVDKKYDKWEVIERIDPDQDMVSMWDLEESLTRILRRWSDVTEVVPLGDRWKKGTMILKPFDRSLKEKEIPIEAFFHKIVMVRDRLRVMEQRVNSSKNMEDEEKVNLQQYITRIYGSLTTFNVLFKDQEDSFKGDSSK